MLWCRNGEVKQLWLGGCSWFSVLYHLPVIRDGVRAPHTRVLVLNCSLHDIGKDANVRHKIIVIVTKMLFG